MGYATLLRTISQLWRTGQKHDVKREILIARHSFNSFLETNMLNQYADILAITGRIDVAITRGARRICDFEILRQRLGQECSRYPRVGASWDQLDEVKLRQQGCFYSTLAKFFFENSKKAALVNPRDVSEIARTWKVGVGITTTMVEKAIPLKNGEGLTIKNLAA
ncbi:hypothetical protein GGI42DRAFT_347658 [Trichoderma sp. SZMC 28013]